jgi:hypothetical protein
MWAIEWLATWLLAAAVIGLLVGWIFGREYVSSGWMFTWPWTRPAWSDLSPHTPPGARAFIELNWGRWMRPVLRPRYWFSDVNPWTGAIPQTLWFTIDFPFAGPLVGWSWNGDGKYIGFKRFPLDDPRYVHWTAAPTLEGGSAITFSARW